MSIGIIRTGLETRLATITGLRAENVWPDTIKTPAAIVRPVRGTVHTTFARRSSIFFEILIVVQESTLARAQDKIDGYLAITGANSVLAAIEGDETLGGAAEDCNVTGWRDYGPMTIGDVQYFGVVFDVEVYAYD